MPLLELQSVSFAYVPDAAVLDGVDLAVAHGEVVAVVGPNGAGKTTLLRLASGWLAPTAGRIRLDGRDLSSLDRRAAARRIAGILASEEATFPFTVEEVVALGRYPWRGAFGRRSPDDDAAVERALGDTDLLALRRRPLTALSSGERQRAAVARCLAQAADLLLLDEPTAHLDVAHRTRALAAFRREARERGRGVLAVLHDLSLAGLVADRIVLLVAGRIAAAGTPGEVLRPAALEAAFGVAVEVLAHPTTGSPVVVPGLGERRP